MKLILYTLLAFTFMACKQGDKILEKKYCYLISNNDFDKKEELKSSFNSVLHQRLNLEDKYPNLQFLKNQKEIMLNDVVLINEEIRKAVFILMSIGMDNQEAEMGSVYILSAEKELDKWVFNHDIDMSFYYFTHHYEGELNFDKISRLAIKRIIKAGYMKEIDKINYKYIDDNWGTLYYSRK